MGTSGGNRADLITAGAGVALAATAKALEGGLGIHGVEEALKHVKPLVEGVQHTGTVMAAHVAGQQIGKWLGRGCRSGLPALEDIFDVFEQSAERAICDVLQALADEPSTSEKAKTQLESVIARVPERWKLIPRGSFGELEVAGRLTSGEAPILDPGLEKASTGWDEDGDTLLGRWTSALLVLAREESLPAPDGQVALGLLLKEPELIERASRKLANEMGGALVQAVVEDESNPLAIARLQTSLLLAIWAGHPDWGVRGRADTALNELFRNHGKKLEVITGDLRSLVQGQNRLEEKLELMHRDMVLSGRAQARASVSDEDAKFEASYRKVMADECSHIDLFIDEPLIDQVHKRLDISPAYVKLSLVVDGSAGGIPIVVDDLLDRLDFEGGIALLRGLAGSGKTTLVRWTAWSASQEAAIPGPWVDTDYTERALRAVGWRVRVPFLVTLRDYVDSGKLPNLDAIHAKTCIPITPPDGWAKRVFEKGRALVLIDGIDELKVGSREAIQRSILGYARAYQDAGNVFIVTSRPLTTELSVIEDAGASVYQIQDLALDARREFVNHWHDAALLRVAESDRDDLEQKRADLLKTLEVSGPISRLAKNPLLAAMLCALNRGMKDLPDREDYLYDMAVKHLIERDRLTHARGGTAVPKVSFPEFDARTVDEKRHAVQAIAREMVETEQSRLGRSAAVRLISAAIHGETTASRHLPEAGRILDGLVEKSGLLRKAGDNDVEFIHDTLQEHLAAKQLTQSGHVASIVNGALGPNANKWRNVARHAAACAEDHEVVRTLLDGFVSPSVPLDRISPPIRLLALECAQRSKRRYDDILNLIERLQSSFAVITAEIAKSLVDSGDESALRLVSCKPERPEDEAAACVAALVADGSENSCEELDRYLASDRRPKVLDALIPAYGYEAVSRVANLLIIPSVFARITTRENWEADEFDRLISNLTPLAGMTGLKELDLQDTHVSDLTPLAGLSALQWLALRYTLVSDLTPLTGLSALQWLDLQNTQVSNLTPLASLCALQRLDLQNTDVSDLSPLAHLPKLQWLALQNTQVSNLTPLASLSSLQQLDLGDTKVNDLTPLRSLFALQELFLQHTSVHDLTPLAGLHALHRLAFQNTRVSNLAPLAGLTALRRLYIQNTPVSNLTPLKGLSTLERLYLQNTPVSDLTPLEGLCGLQRLFLQNTRVSNLTPLSGLAALQRLDLRNTGIGELTPLASLPALQELFLNDTRVSDEECKRFHAKRGQLGLEPVIFL